MRRRARLGDALVAARILSKDRVEEAAGRALSEGSKLGAYLVKRGVARTRLTAVGYGETRPKVPNTSKKNRAINRRVEFIIVHQTQ